jgi:hypothetical protein
MGRSPREVEQLPDLLDGWTLDSSLDSEAGNPLVSGHAAQLSRVLFDREYRLRGGCSIV